MLPAFFFILVAVFVAVSFFQSSWFEEGENLETAVVSRFFFGAAGRIRTADLILTKDALYLLSYSSIYGDQEGARTLDLQRDRLAF